MKLTTLTLLAIATAAAGVALPVPAHAEQTIQHQFLSPSGNIGCNMESRADGTAYAWCKTRDHTWTEPQAGGCAIANVPGAIGEPAPDLQLSQGKPACFGFVMSQLFFSGTYAPPTLDYGRSHTVGSITCSSEPSGVRCADAGSGHFFRVSREYYDLG